MKVRALLGAENPSVYQHPRVYRNKCVTNRSQKRQKFAPSLAPGNVFNPHRLFRGTWTPEWLDERREVSERAKKLYAYLTYFAGSKGRAWPSYARLAEKLHVTRRHVIRLLSELSEYRLIRVTHVNDPKRGCRANIYEFLWHEWMQHPEDQGYKIVVPEDFSPDEIAEEFTVSSASPESIVSEQSELASPCAPPIPRTAQPLPATDREVLTPVTPTPLRSQEINNEELKYKHPEGAWSFLPEERISTTEPDDPFSPPDKEKPAKKHAIPWQEQRGYKEKKNWFSKSNQESPLPPSPSSTQAEPSPGLVRKAWYIARRLLNEFWDNCKIRPDLRILFRYVNRSLQEGYKEESIRAAFERSLHQCHAHATDCGEIWEVSSTVHRAEKWLKDNGSFWKPVSAEEEQRLHSEFDALLAAWRGGQR